MVRLRLASRLSSPRKPNAGRSENRDLSPRDLSADRVDVVPHAREDRLHTNHSQELPVLGDEHPPGTVLGHELRNAIIAIFRVYGLQVSAKMFCHKTSLHITHSDT